jgi:hypothetical protein
MEQMTRKKALHVLNIHENEPSEDVVKRGYRTMALKYHPDKNHAEDAHIRFQEIHEAYTFLKKDVNRGEDSNDYISLLKAFIRTLFENDTQRLDTQKSIIYELIRKITSICEEKALLLLENIDKHILKMIYDIAVVNCDVLHFSHEFMEKMMDIVKTKFEKDERIILHPFIDDLFENNLFKLHIEEKVYIVPLWHHHLVYDISNNVEMYVDCYPVLPDNICIDDFNNIHASISMKLDDIWNNENVEYRIGSRMFSFPRNELLMMKMQTKVFKHQGIPIINANDMYNIDIKGDVFLYIQIEK